MLTMTNETEIRPITIKPIVKPEAEPEVTTSDDLPFIGNTNTGKYHVPGCGAVDMMREEHKVWTDGFGYEKCGLCAGKQ